MKKANWIDKVSNEDVLNELKENKTLLNTIIKKERDWIGHIIRGEGILMTVLVDAVEGERRRKMERQKLINDIKELIKRAGRATVGDNSGEQNLPTHVMIILYP